MIDLLVVGGGPAGLTTALYAARAGLETVVVEPRPAPIDKACGEGLMPSAVAALAELGIFPAGQPIAGIRYLEGARHVQARFRSGTGLGVRRLVLHEALTSAVRDQGIPCLEERIRAVHQDGQGVTAAGLRARYLAAADGLHSPIRRMLGAARPARRGSRPRWGLRQHFVRPPWTDFVEVHWASHAEAYVTPVGEELIGVAILSTIRAPFHQQLQAFTSLAAKLPLTGSTVVRAAGPLRQRVRTPAVGRVLFVGDAAGYVDALTGEGIAVAMAGAQELVACVLADAPQRYERRWLAVSRRYRSITSALLWARGNSFVGPAIVPLATRAPWAFGALVNQLAR